MITTNAPTFETRMSAAYAAASAKYKPIAGERATVLTSKIKFKDARLHSSTKRKFKTAQGSHVIQVHLGPDGELQPNTKHDTFLLRASAAIGLAYVEVRMDAPHGQQPAADKEIQAHTRQALGSVVSVRDIQQWRRMHKTIGLENIAAMVGTTLDDREQGEHLCRLHGLSPVRAKGLIAAATRGEDVSAIDALEAFLIDRELRFTDKVFAATNLVASFSRADKFDFANGFIPRHLATCAEERKTRFDKLEFLNEQRDQIARMQSTLKELDDAKALEIAALIDGAHAETMDAVEPIIDLAKEASFLERGFGNEYDNALEYQTQRYDCGSHVSNGTWSSSDEQPQEHRDGNQIR